MPSQKVMCLVFGTERQFRSRNQLRQPLRCRRRRAAATLDAVICAAKNQRRNFDFRSRLESIPTEASEFVDTILLDGALARPESLSESRPDVAVIAIKVWIVRHDIIVDVGLDVFLEADLLYFVNCFTANVTRAAVQPAFARAACCHR